MQEEGRIWVGGTTWAGRKAIRVSVSNWQTGDEEIELAVEVIPGRDLRGPAAGAVDLALELPAEDSLQPLSRSR